MGCFYERKSKRILGINKNIWWQQIHMNKMLYINISFQFIWSVSWCIWLISYKNNILECSSSLWYVEAEIEAGTPALRFGGSGWLLNCCVPCSACGQNHFQLEFRWETLYNDIFHGKQLNMFHGLWLHFNHFTSNIWVLGLEKPMYKLGLFNFLFYSTWITCNCQAVPSNAL